MLTASTPRDPMHVNVVRVTQEMDIHAKVNIKCVYCFLE